MMFQGCADDEAAISKPKAKNANGTVVTDPKEESPQTPPKSILQLSSSEDDINTYSTKLNAFRDKTAEEHCVSGDTTKRKERSQEITAVLAALSCRITEQKEWLTDELIYNVSSSDTNSCQTQTKAIDDKVLSFTHKKIDDDGIEGWLEFQCKKAVDHILDEKFNGAEKTKLENGNDELEAKVLTELDKILNEAIPYESQVKRYGILASLKNTVYQINNNCAAVALTSDFADTVSSSSANERVKPRYIYRETFFKESDKRIDKLIRASWEDIQKSSHKIKAFSDFSGSDAATESTVDTVESLQTFLDYSPHTAKKFYAQRILVTGCEQDIAYKKMNKITNTSTDPATTSHEPKGTFFSHGNFYVPLNKTALACGTKGHAGEANFKRVIKGVTSSAATEPGIVPAVAATTPEAITPHDATIECRIAKGYAPKAPKFKNFIGTPVASRLIINLTPSTAEPPTRTSSESLPRNRDNYLVREKTRDAIVCHKPIPSATGDSPPAITDCQTANTFSTLLASTDDVDAALLSKLHKTTLGSAPTGGVLNDGHEAERILNEIMTPRLTDGEHAGETPRDEANVKSPLSAFLKNEGGRFSKVGQLLLAFDAYTSDTDTDTVSDQWQKSVTETVGEESVSISSFGGWDFPDASRVAGPLCLYYIHINANNAARRLENRRALEKLFGLDPIEDETQCLAGLNHMDRDVCSVSDDVTSSWSEEEKARFETFCDSE
ncbi:MAG: hypothetical protein OXC44_07815 [Proteobacteria bacterium]|nr:hypothetical protein [Pseudomonadota bacterium]